MADFIQNAIKNLSKERDQLMDTIEDYTVKEKELKFLREQAEEQAKFLTDQITVLKKRQENGVIKPEKVNATDPDLDLPFK